MTKSPDMFGTFLGSINAPSRTAVGTAPASLDILQFINEHGGRVTTRELVGATTMPLASVASTLESLKSTNLIDIQNDPVESIVLTDIGRTVANLRLQAK